MSHIYIDPAAVRFFADGRAVSSDQAVALLNDRPLMVLMHGFGSHENDLIGVAPLLPTDFVFASPRAPFHAPAPLTSGYSWSEEPTAMREVPPLNHEDHPAYLAGRAVVAWLDALEARVANRFREIVLFGFSQGGAMVTNLLRLQPERFAAGVTCSGFIASGNFPGDSQLCEVRPPVFWGHDVADPVIPQEDVTRSAAWLKQHTSLTHRVYPGIGHSISQEEMRDIDTFLNGVRRDGGDR